MKIEIETTELLDLFRGIAQSMADSVERRILQHVSETIEQPILAAVSRDIAHLRDRISALQVEEKPREPSGSEK